MQKSGSEIGVARLSNSLLSASTPRESAPVSVMVAVLDVHGVLQRAGEAELVVEGVVGAGRGDQVVVVAGAAEPLEAVVVAVDASPNDMLGLGAETVHRPQVQLVVRAEDQAGELDAEVGDAAGVVVGLAAAEGERQALGGEGAARAVDGAVAVEHDAAPVTLGARAGRLGAGEDDRVGGMPAASMREPCWKTRAAGLAVVVPRSPRTMLPGSIVSTVAGPPGGVSTVTRPPRCTLQVFGQVWLVVMACGIGVPSVTVPPGQVMSGPGPLQMSYSGSPPVT